ncbi:TRAM domain-containing protein [Desulfosporosinus sp. BICA1-9]|uniref:TRAM domain-containing protein n=1 Tax=Desulfosporosinus sp. BICA1-9 TaxID=1531958 RepID=UPI00054BF108|nr:TRAM domain-containing protein [Desulfosporosinus sp. BICA1-9]KJS47832.1 MAG: hypothetical protein VR66_17570 [Peptococcaceae bacterium BRH_c23]KJS85875.1 MAG: hypothetical protein JL57_17890 [Desulfosporosinus sp. BICA1-9]KJS90117.1 MAG: hypothetical protein JL57_03455 [Desulfosporosinus sp. BICA1-9]
MLMQWEAVGQEGGLGYNELKYFWEEKAVQLKYPANGKKNTAGVINRVSNLEGLRLTSEGMAMGYHEGKATFVPGLLHGEIGQVKTVEVKKNWQRGKLLGILKASADRVNSPCSIFPVCGGCQLQHLKYEQTLVRKEAVGDSHSPRPIEASDAGSYVKSRHKSISLPIGHSRSMIRLMMLQISI